MNIWNKIKEIFLKKEKKKLDEEFEKETLEYTGDEPDCWACGLPIHETHFRRKLNGNPIHLTCFKKLKKIALKGGSIDGFGS